MLTGRHTSPVCPDCDCTTPSYVTPSSTAGLENLKTGCRCWQGRPDSTLGSSQHHGAAVEGVHLVAQQVQTDPPGPSRPRTQCRTSPSPPAPQGWSRPLSAGPLP